MSSRQLRKLQKQRELEPAKLHSQADEISKSEGTLYQSTKPSLFANLADLENNGAQDDDNQTEEEEDEEEGMNGKAHEKSDEKALKSVQPSALKVSQKSKKKKKAKAKNLQGDKTAYDGAHQDGVDDIDVALKELKAKDGTCNRGSTKTPTIDEDYERLIRLLGITTQHLKVANEMRTLFGKAAGGHHDDAGGPVVRTGRRRQQRAQNQQVDLETALKGHHALGKGLPEITLRRNPFIQGKSEWPKATTGGLTMEKVGYTSSSDDVMEFRFKHDKTYQEVQKEFVAYVEMGEPDNLIGLLIKNPYHISLLIQVSKIAKDQGDHALSADLLERALFTFGRASISAFNSRLANGKARLDFQRPENRELWLAGYHYIRSLTMKGTFRTAFEWAKLLLSLEPHEDPYGMRLMIHGLALRAHEFNWLLDAAITSTKLFNKGKIKEDVIAGSHNIPSLAFAAMQLRDGTKVRKHLQMAINTLPWLFCRLFKEINLDAPSSIWGIEPRTDAEALFTEIYISQTRDLWNTPEATSNLVELAHQTPRVDASAILRHDNALMTLAVVRFVYLEGKPSLMALAPSEILHQRNNSDADPLPPCQNKISYWLQGAVLSTHDGEAPDNSFYAPLQAMRIMVMPQHHDDDEINVDDEREVDEEDSTHIGASRLTMTQLLRAAATGVLDPNLWGVRMWNMMGRNEGQVDDGGISQEASTDNDEGVDAEDKENEVKDTDDNEDEDEMLFSYDDNGNPIEVELLDLPLLSDGQRSMVNDESMDDEMPELVDEEEPLHPPHSSHPSRSSGMQACVEEVEGEEATR